MVAPVPIPSQNYRPIISIIGFLIIFIGQKEPCLLLDNKIFKSCNEITFTVYACFWPLLELYKYEFGVHWYIPKFGEFSYKKKLSLFRRFNSSYFAIRNWLFNTFVDEALLGNGRLLVEIISFIILVLFIRIWNDWVYG